MLPNPIFHSTEINSDIPDNIDQLMSDDQAVKFFKGLIDIQTIGEESTKTIRKICIRKIKAILLEVLK
jgi:hypothetical protein